MTAELGSNRRDDNNDGTSRKKGKTKQRSDRDVTGGWTHEPC